MRHREFAASAALAAALIISGCASAPPIPPQALATAPAPVTFDGNVAGKDTDVVLVLVRDPGLSIPGLALRAGETLQVVLPRAFERNRSVAIAADADANLVLTKGWAQGAVRLPGQYRIGFDGNAHAMTVTALRDVGTDGPNAPGIKVIHLRGRTFVNPKSGEYPVTVIHSATDGRVLARWEGRLDVLRGGPVARLAPSNFHLPPGANSDFQKIPVGAVAPQALGLLLWGANGSPLNGVGIAPRDLARFPKYTGGLLVQDTDGDHRLDPAIDKVVGGIVGAAPPGAAGQTASSPLGADARVVLSGEALRNAAYPPAAGGGSPNPGLLTIQFKAGSLPGLYRPTFELIGGNTYQFTIEATAP